MAADFFNACDYLLDRRVTAGDGDRPAVTGVGGDPSYRELLERVQRTAAVLTDLGLQPEQRLMMFMADSPQFVAVFLAAMRIGAIPVPVSDDAARPTASTNCCVTPRARLLAASPEFGPITLSAVTDAPEACGRCSRQAAFPDGAMLPRTHWTFLVAKANRPRTSDPTTADSAGVSG